MAEENKIKIFIYYIIFIYLVFEGPAARSPPDESRCANIYCRNLLVLRVWWTLMRFLDGEAPSFMLNCLVFG